MICHQRKCIFIHIPKTAGTSINSFFHPGIKFKFDEPDYKRLFGWCPDRKIHMQHATAKQLLETGLITVEQWESYFKFTFVRNPWDRAYSDYKFVQKFSGIVGSFKDYINASGTFEEILNNDNNPLYLGDHLLPQTEFFEFEEIYRPDFIGSFENFANDISSILGKLGIRKKFDVHQNISKRDSNYANFYTSTMENLVQQKYQHDIQLLGYSFDKKRTGWNRLKKYL